MTHNGQTKRYFVSGVCCSTEEVTIRKKMDALAGTGGYTFNVVTSELAVASDVDAAVLVRELHRCGFSARSKHEHEEPQGFWQRHQTGLLTAIAAGFGSTGFLMDGVGASNSLAHLFLLVAIIVGGWKIFLKGYRAAKNLSLDMNFLMSVAVIGALAIGKWDEAAAVIILFSLSLMLESYSAARTRNAVRSLMQLSPDEACLLKNGKETMVPARHVLRGEIIVIRPGEKIPLDGIVMEGTSSINEAPITGEATPALKERGDSVFAGSINEHGALTVKVTRHYEDTTLARIVHLVEEAQQAKAPVQGFVDRFARVYTPAVLGVAIIAAIVPPLVMGEPFLDWVYRSLVMLVIACPCALVISTPVTLVSALTNAARHGILVKGGRHLETLASVNTIAFDKTGTLTEGRPKVTDVIPLNSLPREHLLQTIAAIEHRSEHHVANAVMAEVSRSALFYGGIAIEEFEALPGRGVKARVGGAVYYLGNHQLCHDAGFCSPVVEQALGRLTGEGKTAIVLGKEGGALGIVAMKDVARAQSKEAIARLMEAGIKHTVMLSGDHQTTAEHVAEELGIGDVHAGLLPEQKVSVVKELMAKHGTVAMMGDGINDAPALAASSVGIAMGVSGTDAALETADIVLMSDDIGKLPFLFGLSRAAVRTVKQNIALALGLKILFLVLSVAGVATLWMAVLADDGAALLVIFNGLRLLTYKDPR